MDSAYFCKRLRGLIYRAATVAEVRRIRFFVLERKLVRGVDCGGEGGLGARLWFVGARVDLVRGCGLWGRGWAWREAVDCIGELGAGARLWIVGTGGR